MCAVCRKHEKDQMFVCKIPSTKNNVFGYSAKDIAMRATIIPTNQCCTDRSIVFCKIKYFKKYFIVTFIHSSEIILPSNKVIILLPCCAMVLSCVTKIMVVPFLFNFKNQSIISCSLTWSSAAVGSSASNTCGS